MAHAGPRPVRHTRDPTKALVTSGQAGIVASPRSVGATIVPRNDDATIAYIKRTLCGKAQLSGPASDAAAHEPNQEPLEDLLPPLTSSNVVDVQLYALIAVILNQFVLSWYGRITPDRQFIGQIVEIIAHCTRGLEQRLRSVDLEDLLLNELPSLLNDHLQGVRIARTAWHRQIAPSEMELRFHALKPHAALDPVPLDDVSAHDQQENEAAWAVLVVNRVLPLLLPPQDVKNPCLDVLVSEIFSELIIRSGLCGKASEAWLLWEGVTKIISSLRPAEGRTTSPGPSSPQPAGRLQQLGLLPADPITPEEEQAPHDGRRRRVDAVAQSLWACAYLAMTAWTLLRALAGALMQAPSISARSSRTPHPSRPMSTLPSESRVASTPWPDTPASSEASAEKTPFVGMQLWPMVSQLILLEQRMPWLAGGLSFLQWISLRGPGKLCSTNSRIDRLLSWHFHARLLRGDWLASLLQATRSALFPDNALAQPRVPPTSDDIVRIRRDCAAAIVGAVPDVVRTQLFAGKDEDSIREEVAVELLDLFADAYINKHLIVAAVELILARLFPELTVGSDGARSE